ncbi:GyrI-like domain-containing protein [Aquibacillus rhizosphaerae]|uniref:GyrI-like domain-containing protein n=1 Tax=Aquibacillus rhizosphaerae TaxID=3051431 RepID=A0ABT7LAI1_9BACI|nr:GyrI-like domain-containing protein [Aquibacillus sp. LR5S19]MDL4842419.1 GyrI-like domain-containing protein [Aquibacillus sp. LR5S19]
MEATVVKRDAFTIVGYQIQANLKEIAEQQLGKRALDSLKEDGNLIHNKVTDHLYLVQIYPLKRGFDPNVDKFTQVIGYQVSDVDEIPKGMHTHHVPDSSYVTATHKGLESELDRTYDFLCGKWLKENPYDHAGYDFEIWDDRYKPDQADNEIDVFVAIREK